MPTPDKDLMIRLTELVRKIQSPVEADRSLSWLPKGIETGEVTRTRTTISASRMKKQETATHEKRSKRSEHGKSF